MDLGVVAWNTRDELRDALVSIRTFAPQRRTVVVDNASTDGTAQMVRAEFPDVELVVEAANRGFAAGANRVLERTAGSDVLLLNADIVLREGAVDRLEGALAAHPRAAAVGPRLQRPDGSQEHSAYPFPALGLAAVTNLGLFSLGPQRWRATSLVPGTPPPRAAVAVDWVIGAAMALRRAAVDEVGPFDESFFMYAEDVEWCWRAREAGWEVWFEPGATVIHLGNRSGAQAFGEDRTAAWLESTYRFARRAHGRAWAAAYFGLNAVGAGARYATAAVRHRVAPSSRSAELVARWRPHVAYHFRGVRPLTGRRTAVR